MIVNLVFSHLGFCSGNLRLIAPFPDPCLLVPFHVFNVLTAIFETKLVECPKTSFLLDCYINSGFGLWAKIKKKKKKNNPLPPDCFRQQDTFYRLNKQHVAELTRLRADKVYKTFGKIKRVCLAFRFFDSGVHVRPFHDNLTHMRRVGQ